jgi:cold shock protein
MVQRTCSSTSRSSSRLVSGVWTKERSSCAIWPTDRRYPRQSVNDYDDYGYGAKPSRGGTVEGTVKWFNPDKGFGFIAPDQGGKDVFVHIRAVERAGLSTLRDNQRVRFTEKAGQKGPEADGIEVI